MYCRKGCQTFLHFTSILKKNYCIESLIKLIHVVNKLNVGCEFFLLVFTFLLSYTVERILNTKNYQN
jgi:hypothetical protein